VRTQGDANDGADPWTATLDGDHVWQVHTVVPYVGSVIRALRTPAAHNTLLYGVPALLVAWMLSSIWRKQN
jgi:signal peptidase